MYIINDMGKIITIDISKVLNDEELYSYIWKVKYNIEFAKKKQNIIGYVIKNETL